MHIKDKYKNIQKILISRTDAIGDVILTLPMAGLLKEYFPKSNITFLGQTYTQSIVELCPHVDKFLDKKNLDQLHSDFDLIIHVFPQKELAKKLKSHGKYRLGTARRIYHLTTCNIRPNISRKKSDLHEAQLNLMLLKPLFEEFEAPELDELLDFIATKEQDKPDIIKQFLPENKINILIHPKSRGSAIEWGDENFAQLLSLASTESKLNFIFTGTADEESLVKETLIDQFPEVMNSMGKLNLEEFICLVAHSDGIIAGSTGPLHISSLFNNQCFALFPEWPSIGPKRWRPINSKVTLFVDHTIKKREAKKLSIEPSSVLDKIKEVFSIT